MPFFKWHTKTGVCRTGNVLEKENGLQIAPIFNSGVYTDEPRLLSMMAQRQELGDIVCCAT